jgi:hypothetical protein
MTQRAFKLALVAIFLASWLWPSPTRGDAGFYPGAFGPPGMTTGDRSSFAWTYWEPSCAPGKSAAAALTQAAYDDMVADAMSGVRRAFRSATGCSVALKTSTIKAQPGETWERALIRAKKGGLVPGITVVEFKGAEHSATNRERLEKLCRAGYLRGSDCVATDAEINYAGGSTSRAVDLPSSWYLLVLGNGDAIRPECDPALSSGQTRNEIDIVWGIRTYFNSCRGLPRPPRPVPSDKAQPPFCTEFMSRDIPAGPVWDGSGATLCKLGEKGERSARCPVTAPDLTAAGAVQVQAGLGLEWRCFEPVAPEKGIEPTGPSGTSFCDGGLTDYPSECLDVATFTTAQDALNSWQGIIQAGGKVTSFFPDAGGACYVLVFCIP